ncbi:MAG: hypothetical protein R3B90_18000 [Planctomycetaceae bacterium]
MSSVRAVLLGLSLAMIAPQLACGEDAAADASWPQWRGPRRDGTSVGPEWPTSLEGERLTLQWRRELGPSYSGPLVVGDRVFVTETVDEQDRGRHRRSIARPANRSGPSSGPER